MSESIEYELHKKGQEPLVIPVTEHPKGVTLFVKNTEHAYDAFSLYQPFFTENVSRYRFKFLQTEEYTPPSANFETALTKVPVRLSGFAERNNFVIEQHIAFSTWRREMKNLHFSSHGIRPATLSEIIMWRKLLQLTDEHTL